MERIIRPFLSTLGQFYHFQRLTGINIACYWNYIHHTRSYFRTNYCTSIPSLITFMQSEIAVLGTPCKSGQLGFIPIEYIGITRVRGCIIGILPERIESKTALVKT